MEPTRDEPKEDYRLVSYKASSLPKDFKNLITAPFLTQLKCGNDLFRLIDRDSYFANYPRYIDSLLSRDNSFIKMAVLDDETIAGWCLYENKTVHFIWVKKEGRRKGIGKALLPKEVDTITHITKKGINMWLNNFPEAVLNPWA